MDVIKGFAEGGYVSWGDIKTNPLPLPLTYYLPKTVVYSNGTQSISVMVHNDNTVHIDVDALDFLLKAAGFDPSSYTEREAEAA